MGKKNNKKSCIDNYQKVRESTTYTHTLFTDGACLRNPGGRGGIGYVIINNDNSQKVVSASQGYLSTTNNRMELIAVIEGILALDELNPTAALICSDSQYVVNGFAKGWVENWIKCDWVRRSSGKIKPVKNPDLWKILHLLVTDAPYKIHFKWVKGHSNNMYNNECDRLAGDAARIGPFFNDEYTCTLPGFTP